MLSKGRNEGKKPAFFRNLALAKKKRKKGEKKKKSFVT